PKSKGQVKQSICRWCYSKIKLPDLAAAAKKMGYLSIELLKPEEFKPIKEAGLNCAILGGADLVNGLNRVENHDRIVKQLHDYIEFAAAEVIPNVITMSGNRKGMPDEEGLKNCEIGLKKIL